MFIGSSPDYKIFGSKVSYFSFISSQFTYSGILNLLSICLISHLTMWLTIGNRADKRKPVATGLEIWLLGPFGQKSSVSYYLDSYQEVPQVILNIFFLKISSRGLIIVCQVSAWGIIFLTKTERIPLYLIYVSLWSRSYSWVPCWFLSRQIRISEPTWLHDTYLF